MRRIALGRLLLACLLVTCVAIGQAAAGSRSPKQDGRWGRRPGDLPPSSSAAAQTVPDQTKGQTKGAEKKPAAENSADGKSSAELKKPAAEKEPAAKPATQKLKKGPFRIEVALDGVFEAQNQAELFVRPQEWAGLSVLKAVEHGAVVKQGDLVLALDTEKIDRAITDLRAELELNELALKQAAAQLAAAEKSVPLEDQANDRNRRIAEEDWKRFQEVEKPLMAKVDRLPLEGGPEIPGICRGGISPARKNVSGPTICAEETEKIVLRAGQERRRSGEAGVGIGPGRACRGSR